MRNKNTIDGWLGELLKRRNANVAAVALTNKNVRIAWALLAEMQAQKIKELIDPWNGSSTQSLTMCVNAKCMFTPDNTKRSFTRPAIASSPAPIRQCSTTARSSICRKRPGRAEPPRTYETVRRRAVKSGLRIAQRIRSAPVGRHGHKLTQFSLQCNKC
jgi:hypothetical protein